MGKSVSMESNVLFDETGEIKQVTTEFTNALQQDNEDLAEELFEELIDLINSHEEKYQTVACIIIDSRNLTEEYRAKARAYNDLAKRLRDRLQNRMDQQGLKELNAGIFTLRIQRTAFPTVIIDIPVEELPEQFHSIKPDKVKLRDALSDGEKVEGVSLEIGEYVAIHSKG